MWDPKVNYLLCLWSFSLLTLPYGLFGQRPSNDDSLPTEDFWYPTITIITGITTQGTGGDRGSLAR